MGILAWKSALEAGKPIAVPDFADKESRKAVEDDHWSPWPEHAGPGQPPPSVRGFFEPSAKGKKMAKKVWKEIGYDGN